jgi:hypothetical protein
MARAKNEKLKKEINLRTCSSYLKSRLAQVQVACHIVGHPKWPDRASGSSASETLKQSRVQDLRNTMGRTSQQDAVARALLAQKNALGTVALGAAIGLIAAILAEQNGQRE